MKTFFNSLLILSLCFSISYSQTGWISQNSNTNKTLTDVFFINDQKGWIVTDSSKLLSTTNGGLTWSQQTLPYYSPLNTIYFINENTGWVAGGYYYIAHSGVVYKTTNSGNSWFLCSYSGLVKSIFFINENTGFMGIDGSYDLSSSGGILKTTNGGVNWSGQYSEHVILSITFKNSDTGFAIGHYWDDTGHDTGYVYRTTNSGNTWEIKFKESNSSFFYGRLKDVFVKGNHVWAAGKDSTMLYSSDNGENWVKQYFGGQRGMNSVFFVDQNTGWAAGQSDFDTTNIIKTTNGGINWVNQKNNSSGFNWLYSVMFLNAYTGWTVGDYGIVLKTTNGGLTFVNSNSSQIPIGYILHQNYPNPFNPITVIRYTIHSNVRGLASNVKLIVYDNLGKEITTLVNEKQATGNYEVTFDGENLSSGIYFYKLETDNFTDTKRMVLLR